VFLETTKRKEEKRRERRSVCRVTERTRACPGKAWPHSPRADETHSSSELLWCLCGLFKQERCANPLTWGHWVWGSSGFLSLHTHTHTHTHTYKATHL